MAASLLLVAALAWQAFDAARSHRTVAEGVLRDYARLAADEFIRRSVSNVGYTGYYRLLGALRKALAGPRGALPEAAELAAADPGCERALPLARYFFRITPGADRLEISGAAGSGGVDPAAQRFLLDELGEATPELDTDHAYAVRHAVIDGAPHTFIFAAAGAPPRFVGFAVDDEELAAWLAEAFERAPLLPPSLTGDGQADLLLLTVTDASRRQVFSAGRQEALATDPYAELLSAHVPYGDAYEGIFEGFTVHVTLYPSAASQLVIGGLPRARLPLLLGLMGLTIGLLLAAILQLRRARALTALRSDFVSQVSHELRTPLTQIRMFAETLLLGRVRSADESRRSLEIIDAEARRLGHLVENILQFSRGERGAVRLSPRSRPLAPLLREVLRDFTPLVGRNSVSFALHPCDEEAIAAVDGEALRQILLNLLDNAVKYGPEEQQVRVGLTGGEAVRLWVEDEGPGIPHRERERIWRSFHRLERDRLSAVAGTGIGLAVVRQLVELHGGVIRAEAGERGGARFVIELPAAEPLTAPAFAAATAGVPG
ncbi:MAG: HAMP domain-containing sensor histidine kinase [Thermoanaerobaculia bacterium]